MIVMITANSRGTNSTTIGIIAMPSGMFVTLPCRFTKAEGIIAATAIMTVAITAIGAMIVTIATTAAGD